MPVRKLKEFLDRENIKYVSIVHSTAYTAQEVAASAHITGKELAKTVIVELDGKMAMAVLPANRKIVLQDLREVTGSDEVKFASEEEFRQRFPDCETGAMPPFGNLYGMEVYVAEALTENEEIAFQAGAKQAGVDLTAAFAKQSSDVPFFAQPFEGGGKVELLGAEDLDFVGHLAKLAQPSLRSAAARQHNDRRKPLAKNLRFRVKRS